MRLVFMGTPAFAVPALDALIEAGHEIAAVYTQPPRPAGRGHKLQESAVHLCAQKHGLIVKTPVNFKNEADRDELRAFAPELAVVAAYGLILPQSVLDIPVYGCLNIHGSILPRWRGAAPIHRAILAGDTETGITIMRMEAGLDTGPMLLTETTPIAATDTTHSVHDRLATIGAQLVTKVVGNLEAYPPVIQPEEGVTYAHKIDKNESVLNGTESAAIMDRMIRALGGVWLHKNEHRFKLLEVALSPHKNDAVFGTLLNKDGDMTDGQGGVIRITKLQAPNGKIMDVASAINGGLLCVGN